MDWLFSLIFKRPSVLFIGALVALFIGVAAGGCGAWYIQGARITTLKAEHTAYEVKVKEQAVESRLLALDKEKFWRQEMNDAEALARKKVEQMRTQLSALDRTADELRDTVSTLREYLASASRDAAAAAAAALGELFVACTAEYRSVGAAAQGHAIDVEKLTRAWPKQKE